MRETFCGRPKSLAHGFSGDVYIVLYFVQKIQFAD